MAGDSHKANKKDKNGSSSSGSSDKKTESIASAVGKSNFSTISSGKTDNSSTFTGAIALDKPRKVGNDRPASFSFPDATLDRSQNGGSQPGSHDNSTSIIPNFTDSATINSSFSQGVMVAQLIDRVKSLEGFLAGDRDQEDGDYFDQEEEGELDDNNYNSYSGHGGDPPDVFAGLTQVAGQDKASDAGSDDLLKGLKQFFQPEAAPGPGINPQLAEIINAGLRARPNESELEKTVEKYPAPKNCENMCIPKTNPLVWDKMKGSSRNMDNSIQKHQKLLLQSLASVVQVVNTVLPLKDTEIKKDAVLPPLLDCIRMTSSLFMKQCLTRREVVRGDMHPPYTKLCSPDVPISKDSLFGEDVAKTVRDITETDAIGKKLGKGTQPRKSASSAAGAPSYRSPLQNVYNRGRNHPYLRASSYMNRPGNRPFLDRAPRYQYQQGQQQRGVYNSQRRYTSKDNTKDKK